MSELENIFFLQKDKKIKLNYLISLLLLQVSVVNEMFLDLSLPVSDEVKPAWVFLFFTFHVLHVLHCCAPFWLYP